LFTRKSKELVRHQRDQLLALKTRFLVRTGVIVLAGHFAGEGTTCRLMGAGGAAGAGGGAGRVKSIVNQSLA
jgi:hypothetical protein